MMYEARRAFKIFAQSAEAAIKGLCANYGHEICASVAVGYAKYLFPGTKSDKEWTRINCTKIFGAITSH